MLVKKILAVATILICATTSTTAYSCGSYKNLNKCSSAKKALKRLKKKNPYTFDREFVNAGEKRLEAFDYDKFSVEIADLKKISKKEEYAYYTFTLKGKNPTYDHSKLKSPLNQEMMSAKIHYYKSLTKKGKRPLIIGFPTIMKMDKAEPIFSKSMTKRGLSVMILEVESIVEPSIPLDEINNIMRRSIIKARMLIDIAEKNFHEELNLSTIGTWGLSLGGVNAATFIGVDRRVTAAFVISAGGNNADIFTHSKQKFVTIFRNKKLEEYSFTPDQFFNYIRENSIVDPLYFAHRVPSEQINIIMARKDKLIPTRTQIELWNAFGKPGPIRKNWVRGKHKSPIYRYLLVPTFPGRIANFFKKRFKGK